MSNIAGVDEAGRGAVIGPLVICCAVCRREDEKRLRKLGIKDSKQLTPEKREEFYHELRDFVTFRWLEISAGDLNKLMVKMSLNDIEAKTMASLIKNLSDTDIMIDMPDRYNWIFRERMDRFGVTNRFEAQHKADETFLIVAAASICAKVIRDKKIEEIKKATCDFGSGYPSDEKTRETLRDNAKLKQLAPFTRQRWKTLDNLKQRKLFEDEEYGEGQDSE